jgi:hypothetical protein
MTLGNLVPNARAWFETRDFDAELGPSETFTDPESTVGRVAQTRGFRDLCALACLPHYSPRARVSVNREPSRK